MRRWINLSKNIHNAFRQIKKLKHIIQHTKTKKSQNKTNKKVHNEESPRAHHFHRHSRFSPDFPDLCEKSRELVPFRGTATVHTHVIVHLRDGKHNFPASGEGFPQTCVSRDGSDRCVTAARLSTPLILNIRTRTSVCYIIYVSVCVCVCVCG